MSRKRIGTIIIPPGVFIDVHEKMAADYLAVEFGYSITFLLPNRTSGSKTPDIKMDNKLWEIKSPKGKSSRTIENNLRNALVQSSNIVLDLRRIDGRIPTSKLFNEAERQFQLTKPLKRLIIIGRKDEYKILIKSSVKKKAGWPPLSSSGVPRF